jgi:hypothetical protein
VGDLSRDVRGGEVEMIADPGARMAVGMKFDRRSDLLWSPAAPSAPLMPLMARQGFGTYQLTASSATFINDVSVTKSAAYFTDSFQKQFYRLPLGPMESRPIQPCADCPLGDGFGFTPGEFNTNGIVAARMATG